ncbi:MAG: selenocysteine-specific translation elongation factor [Chromatiales bacterium]|nr:selenocysteine-specific translation elongation factor [Chromatiales bacterium]
MIVATAGHVDHGKTALVRALTGVDTDRLPEEKKRGLTIDLGFAYHPLDADHVLGFVDVPGHERFVRNMLAGVGSIDLALVVVAADDGVMPQTREHTAILDLLGVSECIAVVSKVDKVDAARVDEVGAEIDTLLRVTAMRGAEVHRVSALSGAGVEALAGALRERALGLAARAADGRFRLCVDRAFMLRGAGLVVTGTVHAGVAATGERLVVTPSGYEARIRGIHAQDRPAGHARAGQRCALNLAGRDIESGAIVRGDWLVDRALHAPTDRIDVRLHVLPGEPRAVRHWTPVHAHLAAAHSTARVAVLGIGSIAPGESGRVQVVLDRPMHALAGDRIVIRDQSATRTMGGGAVIDPFSPKRGRARPVRLAWLDAIGTGGPEQAVARAIETTATGVDTDWIRRAFGLTNPEMNRILDAAGAVRVPDTGGDRCFSAAHWAGLQAETLAFLETFHRERPRLHGANANDIRLGVARRVDRAVVEHALASLLREGAIARRGATVRLPEHRVTLGTNDERAWPRVARALDPAKGSPPSLRQASEQLKIDEAELGALLRRATNAGLVVPVTRTRFVPLGAVSALAAHAESLADGLPEGRFTAAEYKNHARIGRNFAIELLEFFDRSGFTERLGDRRRVRRPAAEVFGTEDGADD